jgi:hypothetical protein
MMSSITVEIPNSIRKKLEELAQKEGFSVEQFIASATSEKLAIMLQTDFLESEAKLGSREAFEKVLAAVPDVDPIHPDDVIKE